MEGLKQKQKSREKRLQEFKHNVEPFFSKKNSNNNLNIMEIRNEKYDKNKSNIEKSDNTDLISKTQQKIQSFQKIANFHSQTNYGKFMELSNQFNVKNALSPITSKKIITSNKFTDFFSKWKQQIGGSKHNYSYLIKSQNSSSYFAHNKNIRSGMQIEDEEKEEIYNFKTSKTRKMYP